MLRTVLGIEQETTNETQVKVDPESKEESVKVLFSMNREELHSAVKEIIDKVKECYEGWAKHNETLMERMRVSFVIGHTESKMIKSTLSDVYLSVDEIKHSVINGCIHNLIEELSFETIDKKVTVNYPLQLGSKF